MTIELIEKTSRFAAIENPMTLNDLKGNLDLDFSESMDIGLWTEIVDELAKYGFGVAPNSLLFDELPTWNDSIYLYRTHVNHRVGECENPYFHIALMNLAIGAYIFSSAGVASTDALEQVARSYKNLNRDISESDIEGLHAHIRYFQTMPPTENMIRKLKKCCEVNKDSPSNPLTIFQLMVLHFTKSLDTFDPRAKDACKNIHGIFDLILQPCE